MVKTCSKKILAYGMVFSFAACGSNNETLRLHDDPTQEQPAQEVDWGNLEILGEPILADPFISPLERQDILAKYNYLDPNRIVPSNALEETVLYFEKRKFSIRNPTYIAVINFAQSSKEKRFYIINMITGAVEALHVAHGRGSDADHDGYAERFSNKSGTNSSSLGFYTTAETYYGEHGLSLRLDGRSITNSNARSRAIVLHGADYVREESLIQGRSWGCPAVSMDLKNRVVNMLKGGALVNAVK